MLTALLLLTASLMQAPVDLETAVQRADAGDTYDVLWVVGAERPGRFEAAHPELDLRAAFGAGAVEIVPADGAWHWAVQRVALERGGERVEVTNAELQVERDVVLRSGALLDERFIHRRYGLEHGFAIAERPLQHRAAPLELCLSLDTDLVAHLDSDARGVEFRDECERAVLSYRGLSVWDAAGRQLHAKLRVDGKQLVIAVDDANALYPIDVDPLISTSETKLIPPAAAANSLVGRSVAIDGDVAAVSLNSLASPIAMFERAAGVWTQTATINAEHAILDLDGEWLLTARWDSSWCGDVAMFRHVGSSWIAVPGVSSPDCTFNNCFPAAYGFSADLDGERVAVSDPEHLCGAPAHSPAVVYIFEYSASLGAWRPKQEIFPPTGGFNFGDGVALDGDDLLVSNRTEVFHYHRDATLAQFVLQGTVFTGLHGAADYGELHPIALRDNIAVIGDPGDDAAGTNAGAVHIVEQFGATWRLAVTLHTDSLITTNAFLGADIAFDGSVAAIGDPMSDLAATDGGAVQLHTRNGGWTRAATVTASDATADDRLGSAVALDRAVTAGRVRLHAGAPNDDDLGSNSGAGYVVELDHVDAQVYCTAKLNSANCIPRMGFSGSPSLSSTAPFTLSATNVINQRNGVFFYGTSGRAVTPFQGGYRCAQSPTRRTGTLSSGGNPTGTDCSGVLAFDFNSWLQSGADPSLIAGAIVDGQFWYRDGAASFGTGLSEAIELVVQP